MDSIPYVGYESNCGVYVYPQFAVTKGRIIPMNKDGYFAIGRKGIKTSHKAIRFTRGAYPSNLFNLVYQAWGNNGLVALAAWTQALFAEQIRSQLKSLPFYELTGEPGAGKSALIRNLWRCLGREGWEGLDSNKTRPAGRRRSMGAVSNMPVVLIESDRMDGGRLQQSAFDWNDLKTLYDHNGTLGTLGIAKRGNDTDEAMFRAALFISQNASVDSSPAVLERIVHLHFTTAKWQNKPFVDQLNES